MQQKYKEIIVQAPTGQSKSYHSMKRALEAACLHQKRVVFATSTLILVDQVYKELMELQTTLNVNNVPLASLPVTISKHTSHEPMQPGELLKVFEQGSVIIVTVHNYLKEFDDCNQITTLYCFIMTFIKNVDLFIDEGHLFFNDVNTRLPLSETWYEKEGVWSHVNKRG